MVCHFRLTHIATASAPALRIFNQITGNEPQIGRHARKGRRHPGPPTNFPVESLQDIRGTDLPGIQVLKRLILQVVLQARLQQGHRFVESRFILLQDGVGVSSSGSHVRLIPDLFEALRDGLLLFGTHFGEDIPHEVDLAPLPAAPKKFVLNHGLEALRGIRHTEPDTLEPPLFQIPKQRLIGSCDSWYTGSTASTSRVPARVMPMTTRTARLWTRWLIRIFS